MVEELESCDNVEYKEKLRGILEELIFHTLKNTPKNIVIIRIVMTNNLF